MEDFILKSLLRNEKNRFKEKDNTKTQKQNLN